MRLRDMVAAKTAREEARLLDFYAAIEAADAIAVDFHPGFASAVFDSFGVGDTVAVAARGVACGGLAEVEEMAEGEALGAVLDEGLRVRMNGICPTRLRIPYLPARACVWTHHV